jgi:hypothetical protein
MSFATQRPVLKLGKGIVTFHHAVKLFGKRVAHHDRNVILGIGIGKVTEDLIVAHIPIYTGEAPHRWE